MRWQGKYRQKTTPITTISLLIHASTTTPKQPGVAALVPQANNPDLGVRMRSALARELAGGGGTDARASPPAAAAVVVVGSDVPDLAAPAIAAVLASVREAADVSFGPSPDGGFYAVAARAAPVGMLGGEGGVGPVPWSTPAACEAAATAARAAGLAVSTGEGGCLACLADIDTIQVRAMERCVGARDRVRPASGPSDLVAEQVSSQ
jgi:glycosyltransferase A (GT-A) superfamily protein (DUF2064 family)